MKVKPINIKITRLIWALPLIISFSACSEDFLEVEANKPTEANLGDIPPENIVNAVYNQLLAWEVNSFSWLGVSSITSDDADKGSSPGDTGADKDKLDALDIDPTILSLGEVWRGHYTGIQRASQALSRISGYSIDEDLKNRLLGEAKFLRALFSFRLLQMFGGITLLPENPDIDASPEDILKRSSKAETFAFIENDLKEAINSLPEKSQYEDENIGRATKGAAKALLAKVSMYQEKWDVVKNLTDEIIVSREYSLLPNYEDIWKDSFENNAESIFEIQAIGGNPSVGIDKIVTVQGARGSSGWGWGFNTPSQDLAEAYETNDSRRDATIIFRGETLYDNREIPTDPNQIVNDRYNQKAYVSEFTNDEINGKNVILFRYAEVLLMNAEAAIKVGGDAATPLNTIRSRAGLPVITAPTLEQVWKERRLELAMECDRYFDLVRQGRAGQVLRSKGIPFVDGKHELFPIPQQEIDKGQGAIEQNPNY